MHFVNKINSFYFHKLEINRTFAKNKFKMSKKPHTPRVGRPPEWRTPRKQLTLLLPIEIHERVKDYARSISKPYKLKRNAVTS